VSSITHPQAIASLVGMGIDIWYFAKRWSFMASEVSNAEPGPDEVLEEPDAHIPG